MNGKQCTVAWYVDDNKISHHKDSMVGTQIADIIESRFGKLSRSRGKKHTFLGMDIKLLGHIKVAISTPQHLQEALDLFGEIIKGDVVNPANHRFLTYVRRLFHSIVALLLCIMKRSRPDLPAISFLCTRAKVPREEDWGKLRRVMRFVKGTINDRIMMGTDDMLKLETWVDASHAVYEDMKGVTGGCMSLGGWGMVHARASKQRLNTKSTCESELVGGVSKYVPFKIHMINVLEGQGYFLERKVLYQDNQSAMKLEINGRNSCTGNLRHISIKYFFGSKTE